MFLFGCPRAYCSTLTLFVEDSPVCGGVTVFQIDLVAVFLDFIVLPAQEILLYVVCMLFSFNWKIYSQLSSVVLANGIEFILSCNKISISVVICFSTNYRHKNISSTHSIDLQLKKAHIIWVICMHYLFIYWLYVMYLILIFFVCGSYWFNSLCCLFIINFIMDMNPFITKSN